MNYILTPNRRFTYSSSELFEHKLKALCIENDIDIEEIYSKKDLQEFTVKQDEEDYY